MAYDEYELRIGILELFAEAQGHVSVSARVEWRNGMRTDEGPPVRDTPPCTEEERRTRDRERRRAWRAANPALVAASRASYRKRVDAEIAIRRRALRALGGP